MNVLIDKTPSFPKNAAIKPALPTSYNTPPQNATPHLGNNNNNGGFKDGLSEDFEVDAFGKSKGCGVAKHLKRAEVEIGTNDITDCDTIEVKEIGRREADRIEGTFVA